MLIVILMLSSSLLLVECSLYDESDPILQLNLSDFYQNIVGQKEAFMIEFYNSWCGHCIRYAPEYKILAKNMQSWNRVLRVAVLDCSVTDNFEICRDFEIASYPTVRYFWPYMKKSDRGITLNSQVEKYMMEKQLIDLIEKNSTKMAANWPRIKTVSSTSVKKIFSSLQIQEDSALLVVEVNRSYIGRSVILDVSSLSVTLVRVLDTNQGLLNDIKKNTKIKLDHLPVLLHIKKNGEAVILKVSTRMDLARIEFQHAIYAFLKIPFPKETPSWVPKDNGSNIAISAVKDPEHLHMVDLENAIHYLLRQEVALKDTLQMESLAAFKGFLGNLTRIFPGTESMYNFLTGLNGWVQIQKPTIHTEEMAAVMDDLQTKPESRMPHLKPYAHCRGSNSMFRGYPCSLWSLFHTMTVSAYKQYLKGELDRPQSVLFSIRDYVANFFSCSECAKHFGKMAVNLERDVKYPNDSVIWLWQAHNQVNARLAGDPTEDPSHKKVQFPPSKICEKCVLKTDSTTTKFNKAAVLTFLTDFYSSKIVATGPELDIHLEFGSASDDADHKGKNAVDNRDGSDADWDYWRFKYFSRTDISLCLLLYISSAALLLIVYFVVLIRRRKRRNNCAV